MQAGRPGRGDRQRGGLHLAADLLGAGRRRLHLHRIRARRGGNADPSAATRRSRWTRPPRTPRSPPGPTGTSEPRALPSLRRVRGRRDVECRLDGAAFAGCGSPATYEDLAEGRHTFETRATDALGNVDATPAARTFRPAKAFPPVGVRDRLGRGRCAGALRDDGCMVDDGERLEVKAAEKRSRKFVSSFYAFFAIGGDGVRSTLRSLEAQLQRQRGRTRREGRDPGSSISGPTAGSRPSPPRGAATGRASGTESAVAARLRHAEGHALGPREVEARRRRSAREPTCSNWPPRSSPASAFLATSGPKAVE